MRYYSTQRPITPGSCPRTGIRNIVNFVEKTFCDDIQMEAYGYIETEDQLEESEIARYELVPDELKTFWCVTTAFYDDGYVTSSITDTKKCAVKPYNNFTETSKKDIYIDWFDSEEEANQYVQEALSS